MHRVMYGPGVAQQQRQEAQHSFALWHGASQMLNLMVLTGITVYLWRVTTPGSGYRHRA
jgi:hypothetical protein